MNYRKFSAFALSLCLMTGTVPFTAVSNTVFAESSAEYDDETTLVKKGQQVHITLSDGAKTPVWYSDRESVATVDENGVITAVGEGTALVYAVFENQVIKIKVTVKFEEEPQQTEVNVGTVNLDNEHSEVTVQLNNLPEGTPLWKSSDESVAVVDQSGNVTAKGTGTCKVTAEIGGITYTATIVSTYVPKENDGIQDYVVGEFVLTNEKPSTKIIIDVPEGTEIKWSSSDESIATVDRNGIVIAHSKGTCSIFAEFDNLRYISAIKSEFDLESGASENFLGTVELSNEERVRKITLSAPEGTEIKWSSSDESIATVSQDGTVTAEGTGTCKIIASCNGTDYVISINSTYVAPRIDNDGSEFEIKKGDSLQLTFSGSETPEWLSMNTEVATVDSNGLVTAVGEGEATIIVKFTNSVASVKVRVTAEESKTVYGDANEDGSVNISDAVLILQSIANPDNYKLSEQGKLNGDVSSNGDGITAGDALVIQQVEAGIYKPENLPLRN